MGHNIYILCHQLAEHNKELATLVRAAPAGPAAPALQYYRTHTAQIEVCIVVEPRAEHMTT